MNSNAGIVITTRNREQDLKKLFCHLKENKAWQKYPIWVHDDASNQVSEDYWKFLSKYAYYLIRNPRNYGASLNRNISNASAPFDFIFSLDDDSCFVDTDGPAQAIEYMENHPKVAILSFPLVSSFNPPPIHHTSPYPCLSYAACAALIRKSAFLEVGGYYSDFFYYGEEPELCLRLWAAGYEIHAFPLCRVYHWVSSNDEDYRCKGFYGPQNRVWTHILHTPIQFLLAEVLRTFPSYSKLSLQTKIPLIHFKGLISGIKQGILHLGERQPLPLSLYIHLKSLPVSAQFKTRE
ncbi:glycosyltransferase family 2 protein [Coleofasciculus sp. G2-EDA-02]|uniref:glycosyltransferase family 2 protein n=1 Tax=Coleofasciculus sp. G2-EDA-02 TaxID=3069529 RepID=UPI0032F47BC1